jgi:Cys-tRNA(Pro)/Cys-tRNA(Cys) deacylase
VQPSVVGRVVTGATRTWHRPSSLAPWPNWFQPVLELPGGGPVELADVYLARQHLSPSPPLERAIVAAESIEDRIAERLRAHGVRFTIHEHVVSHTVADARDRLSFSPDAFLKTIAFRLKRGGWVLAALRGQDRVDYRGLAAALGVSRRELQALEPAERLADLGYPGGGVGPVPPNDATRVVFDRVAVEQLDAVYCGAGRDDRTLEARLTDLVRACDGLVAPIAQPPA